MKYSWEESKIRDFAEVKGGKRLPKGKQLIDTPNLHPYIRIRDLGQTKTLQLTSEMQYVDDETQLSISRYIVNTGDILISVVGTIGLVSIVGDTLDGANQTENCDKIINIKNVLPEYLYYYLISDYGQDEIKKGTVGAVQPKLPLKNVLDITVKYPEIATQRKIVSILSDFDNKIALNNAINNNLEQQAMAIFKSWFVDFEPFDGDLPNSWTNKKIGNVCRCVLGGTPSRTKPEYWNGTIPWINSGEVNNFRIIKPSETITELGLSKSATKLLPAKTTVIAITGATLGQVSLLEIDSCANQSVVGIIPNTDYPYEYIYPLVKQNISEIVSHQTGGAQQHINKQNVENLDILVPTASDLNKYCDAVRHMYEMIANNCFENEYLTSLRDALLPKLMSGELDVSELDL